MAGLIVRGISDRYWTEHTGVRTGDDGMSHFWDDKNEGAAELDELFDGEPLLKFLLIHLLHQQRSKEYLKG